MVINPPPTTNLFQQRYDELVNEQAENALAHIDGDAIRELYHNLVNPPITVRAGDLGRNPNIERLPTGNITSRSGFQAPQSTEEPTTASRLLHRQAIGRSPRQQWETFREETEEWLNPRPVTITKEKMMVARPYSAYTVGDLLRLNKGFMRKYAEPEKIDEQLRYVQSIAQSNPLIINAKYLELLCVDGEKANPILDKGLINKALFEYLDNFKAPATEGQVALLDTIVAEYSAEYAVDDKTTIESSIRSAENDISHYLDNIGNYQDSIKSCHESISSQVKRIDKLELELDSLGTIVPTEHWVLTEVRKIISAGDWEYLCRHDSCLYLRSTASVMCRHSLPAAGIDKSLDFGKFVLRINNGGDMSVWGIEDTITLGNGNNPEHPHINRGSICWGNMRDKVSQLRQSKQLMSSVQILNQLLRDYSPNAPYRSFNSFNRAKKNRTTMTFEKLESMFSATLAKVIYPEHKSFDDLYEEDTERYHSQAVVGDHIRTNGGRRGVIVEIIEGRSYDFRYERSANDGARVVTANFRNIATLYKLKEQPNDEQSNQETTEESTSPQECQADSGGGESVPSDQGEAIAAVPPRPQGIQISTNPHWQSYNTNS